MKRKLGEKTMLKMKIIRILVAYAVKAAGIREPVKISFGQRAWRFPPFELFVFFCREHEIDDLLAVYLYGVDRSCH